MSFFTNDALPVLPLKGEGNKDVLIILENYDSNYQFTSTNDVRFLRDMFPDILSDTYITALYDINEKRNLAHTKLVHQSLHKLITKIQPKAIILMGELVFDALIHPRMVGRINGTGWEAFVGEQIPDQTMKTWLCPVWPVDYLLTRKDYGDGNKSDPLYKQDPSISNLWQYHVKNAVNLNIIKLNDYTQYCVLLHDETKAMSIIEESKKWDAVAFDYETTGIKPQKEGHEICYISISNGIKSYSFPNFNSDRFKKAWTDFLVSDVPKISHNLQFETIWSHEIYNVYPKNWIWDTMLVQHCLNNQKPTSLKFVTYCQFGVIGYDDSIDKYIKSSDNYGDNSFNRMKEAPVDECLLYNALDSLFTYKIYENQKDIISKSDFNYMDGIEFSIETAITFAKMHITGMCINTDFLYTKKQELQNKLQELEQKIMASEEVKSLDGEEVFNFNSAKQLSHLLFDILKVKPIAFTERNAPSVDKLNLPKYKLPFIQDILEYRKYYKILETYFAQYEREIVDGKIHPFFYNHRVDTFRSCVAKGTSVLTPSNSVPIEDIKVGDYVYSFDDDLNLTLRKVLWSGKTGHRNVVRIHYQVTGGDAGYIDVTPEHKIRLINGEYVEAKDLMTKKNTVLSINFNVITSIEYLPDAIDVYDIEVEETHNFIAGGICVHNSSSSPNIQQSPKRDKEAKEYIRKFIIPSKGNKLVEYDYSQLEVRISACHNKDPSLIKYVTDPDSDMHRDSAMDCYLLPKDKITKEIRSSVKGDFVFAEFYGSFYKKIAKDLWESVQEFNMQQHMLEKGIKNYVQFEKHIEIMERKFWNVRFPVYNEWRKKQFESYKRTGYVDQYTGFRCFGPMKRNNTFNTPVQGDAAHVLLWAMNQVNKEFEKRNFKSKIVAEIHDSLVIDMVPEEEEKVDVIVWKYATQTVTKWWDWITVPLQMEKEATPVDGTWADAKSCGILEA